MGAVFLKCVASQLSTHAPVVVATVPHNWRHVKPTVELPMGAELTAGSAPSTCRRAISYSTNALLTELAAATLAGAHAVLTNVPTALHPRSMTSSSVEACRARDATISRTHHASHSLSTNARTAARGGAHSLAYRHCYGYA
jgi:hypothetical protein